MNQSNHPESICPHFLHGCLLGLLDIRVARGAACTHGKKRQANNGNGRSRLNWPRLVPNARHGLEIAESIDFGD